MKLLNQLKKWLRPGLIVVVLVILLGVVGGCDQFGLTPPPAQEEPAKVTPLPTVVHTRDTAILTVYEHLLDQAQGYQAKKYLADYYTVCDNWSAESEFFRDGSGVWRVQIDMTGVKQWNWQPYWQKASWFVFRDGKVIPATQQNANALRIEADLQELSPESKS